MLFMCWNTTARALELNWDAPEACPPAGQVEAAVARLAADRQGGGSSASVKIVQLADDRWSAELRWGGAMRTLHGESCQSVTQALVVILAMAIDPEVEADREGPPARAVPKGSDSTVVEAAVPQSSDSGVVAAAARRSRERAPHNMDFAWGASLRTLAEFGILPDLAWGGSALLRGGLPRNFGEIALLGLLPHDALLPNQPTQGGQFYWLGVRLTGCTALGRLLFACAAFEAGQITGTGFGVVNPRTGSGPWLAPGAQGLLKLPLAPHWHFEASLGGFIALVRPEFELDHLGVVHQANLVSARLELGIGWN